MVDRDHPDLPVSRQCQLLDIPRSTFYYVADPVSDADLEIMALIDQCHLERPFYGSHRIRGWLADQGHLVIYRPNQVWVTDITYIPMARGFVYLVAVMDWYSRKVLSWRVSNTLDTRFCVEALEEAIETYGCPEIFNTDQGSQFTSEDFTGVLKKNHIQISMDEDRVMSGLGYTLYAWAWA